jgi:hypothetical protein
MPRQPKQLASLPEIANYVRQTAAALRAGSFVEPPKILDTISYEIEKGAVTDTLLQATWGKLQKSVENEFCDETWKKPMLHETANILDKGSPSFTQALLILDETRIPLATCLQIIGLANAQSDILVAMQLRCFAYLICVEGVYDEIMRFLYAIYKKRPPRKSDLKIICENMKIAKIGNAIIGGYHPTVRNAIAHASFVLDTTSQVAEFTDRSGHVEKMSFDDFALILAKVLCVGVAASTLVLSRIMMVVAFSESLKVIKKNQSAKHTTE